MDRLVRSALPAKEPELPDRQDRWGCLERMESTERPGQRVQRELQVLLGQRVRWVQQELTV